MPEEKKITVEQLRAEYPELVGQIEKASMDESEKIIDEKTEALIAGAKKAERDRILSLVDIQFGEEVGEKFKAVVETEVSPEQLLAIREASGWRPSAETDELKEQMLSVINYVSPPNPGAEAPTGGRANYIELVNDYQREHKCNKFEAMSAINSKHPSAREDYINSVN